jgi:hypothetical protein
VSLREQNTEEGGAEMDLFVLLAVCYYGPMWWREGGGRVEGKSPYPLKNGALNLPSQAFVRLGRVLLLDVFSAC